MKKRIIPTRLAWAAAAAVTAACLSLGGCAAFGASDTSDPLASLKNDAMYTAPATPRETTEDTSSAAIESSAPAESTTDTSDTSVPPVLVTSTPDTADTPAASDTTTESTSTTTAPVVSDTVSDTTAAPDTTTVAPAMPADTDKAEPVTSEPETIAPDTTESAETDTPMESYLDFDTLRKINPDICAWIEIEGTLIDLPILQSSDDTYYLTHDYEGKSSVAGAIFTESAYNSTDFNDPVTVIYGHNAKRQNTDQTVEDYMFGGLQPLYADGDSFREHSEIKIYLPGETRRYTVFAAVPYDNIHILYNYDFSKNYWYKSFFKSVFAVRAIGANFSEDVTVEPGDRVIILSVCLKGDDSRRYLVMAVLQEDITP